MGANHVLFLNAFNNTNIGDKSWFVSPTLDFSAATEASLTFDLSYAFRGSNVDQLLSPRINRLWYFLYGHGVQ